MKRILFALVLIVLLSSCEKARVDYEGEEKTDILQIYCNDVFFARGLLTKIIPEFEKRYDCRVVVTQLSEDQPLIAQVAKEKGNPTADVVVGIKSLQLFKAIDSDIFQTYESPNTSLIQNKSLFLERRFLLTPIAYSYFAFVYDSDVITEPPRTIAAFQGSTLTSRFITPDPTISPTAHSMLLWSLYIFGEKGFELYWNRVKKIFYSSNDKDSELMNWAEAYTVFQAEVAPIMIINSTYPAYYIEQEKTTKFKSFIPDEGGFKDIEYVGIVRGAKNLFLARRFVDHLLTSEVQKEIPSTLWMYPSITNIPLPKGFYECVIPTVDLTENLFEKKGYFHDKWIETWVKIMTSK